MRFSAPDARTTPCIFWTEKKLSVDVVVLGKSRTPAFAGIAVDLGKTFFLMGIRFQSRTESCGNSGCDDGDEVRFGV
jgi:hypothetical protein